jgi:hypothetical protein
VICFHDGLLGGKMKITIIVLMLSLGFNVFAENWKQMDSHQFTLWKSLFRSQGLTNDGHGNFWFSSAVSLMKTSDKWASADDFSFFPYPEELNSLGINHIGDIDYFDGKLVVPLEDGSKYEHPHLAIYNAETLEVEKYKAVPRDWQIDGVPWAAVDVANGRIYSAQYRGTTKLNVYDINTLEPVTQIPMSQEMNAIQGAKVLDGSLYMTANAPSSGFAIYKMNLSSGAISQVGELASDVTEVEGLTFVPHESEVSTSNYDMYVIAVTGKGLKRRTKLCEYQKVE